jgi:DNA polymerase bacteriophage-type
VKVHLDIETRSRADLPSVGAYRYGCDPSTQVFMAAVSEEKHDAPVYLWINPLFRDAGVPSDPEAIELLAQATEVRAFNAPFEQPVLHGTSFRPYIPLEAYRCTQAMARIAGLPESLDKCGDALGIASRKDAKGKTLIRHFSIPRKEDSKFNQPVDFPEKWALFAEYCRQDVRAEKEIHRLLRPKFDLTGLNLETFLFTMRMNALGVPVNTEGLRNAQRIIDEVQRNAGAEFQQLTGVNITQRAKVLAWLQAGGVPISDMQAETLQTLDLTQIKPRQARAISLYIQLSYAAAKKVTTMLDWVMPDNRLRGVMKFYGAGTGRWSAGGPQIQNAKKATPAMRPITKMAYAAICKGATPEALDAVYGEPMEVIASCIRHFIQSPGEKMLDADYNAIEARIICWLAKEQDRLAMWANGQDLYKWMASQIYGVQQKDVTGDQRDMGKRVILGCGYGMGAAKFLATCEAFGVACDAALAERAVETYRSSHPHITAYWRRLNANAMSAVRQQGTRFGEFVVENAAGRSYLFCTLPSGRRLAYPAPQIDHDPNFGEQLTYWGQLFGSVNYGRIKLYGGKLAENICQATAADVMSRGARVAEARGMMPFALIHDQALALCEGRSPGEFSDALTDLPDWARGLPLKAEAKITPFYSK